MHTWFKQPNSKHSLGKLLETAKGTNWTIFLYKTFNKNSVKNVHVHAGADAISDHNMVLMKVHLRLKRPH